jgi:hypothetical protein
MASFNLDNYETVEDRLVKFWEQHPDGRVLTNIHYYDDTRILVRAEIFFNREDDRPVATGYAEELRGASPVNRTSHAENAETSAIGRGLANCGYATKGSRPSREEMEKVQRSESAPATPSQHSPSQGYQKAKQAFNAQEVNKPAPTIKNPGATASDKQLGLIRSLIRGKEMNESEGVEYVSTVVGREISSLSEILMGEASNVITALKSIAVIPEPSF